MCVSGSESCVLLTCVVAVTVSVRCDVSHCADSVATLDSDGTERRREVVRWHGRRRRLWHSNQCTFTHVANAHRRNYYSTSDFKTAHSGAITSKIKPAIKHKTSPARLAQLLQPSLAFCFSLLPATAHRPVRCHWLQAKTKCYWGLQQLCKSCRICLKFYCIFISLVIAPCFSLQPMTA